MFNENLNPEVFTRGVADIITKEGLKKLLQDKRQLRVKHGIDATSPYLHIGHAANLWKLRALQEAGHKAVIILGDFTTHIGDPTGRLKSRPQLGEEQIERNVSSIKTQIEGILLNKPAVCEVRRNSEWLGEMSVKDFLQVLSLVTHARLIERDMFQERINKGEEVLISELIYPVLQGYDSVAVKSDLTIIGSDQIFNEHLGRFFQEKFKQSPQVIVALELLPGLDGKKKMSKSEQNFIGLLDSPKDKFGKAMKVLDDLIVSYMRSYTDISLEKIADLQKKLEQGLNPKEAKLFLAEQLVARYHGKKIAKKEKDGFESVFSKKELPEDMETRDLAGENHQILDLLIKLKLAPSRSEAKRLVLQRAVEVGGKTITDPTKSVKLKPSLIVKVGKRRFVKIGRIKN